MYSLKMKFFSLAAAGALCVSLAGCNLSTPATVGTIGGVEIPAGVYLLAQYNAYNTASGVAELATGETAQNVKAVLKAECTGTIGDEEVTAAGSEYVEKLTLRAIEYYAAVEKTFAELGGELSEDAVAESNETADSLWESNGDLYTKNGIGKESVKTYLLNSQKAKAILELQYGENGTAPVTDEELTAYINDNCYYIESVQLPLMDYSTYSFATEEQDAAISAIADDCLAYLEETATGETAASDTLYTAAMTYVPQAVAAMGGELDAYSAVYYASSQLYTPEDVASFASGDTNTLTDPLDEAGNGQWVKIDLGMSYLVARRLDPLTARTLDELNSQYDLLDSMKSGDVQAELYETGAGLEHALNTSALKTYSADKIKKS